MREIKYRIFDTKQKHMFVIIINGYYKGQLDYEILYPYQSINRKIIFDDNIDRYIFMRYTGLHDKAGKEIYEGDIIKYDGVSGVHEIVFGGLVTVDPEYDIEDYCRGFLLKWGDGSGHCIPDSSKCEIIGNKFETPELLENKRKDK